MTVSCFRASLRGGSNVIVRRANNFHGFRARRRDRPVPEQAGTLPTYFQVCIAVRKRDDETFRKTDQMRCEQQFAGKKMAFYGPYTYDYKWAHKRTETLYAFSETG